MPASTVDLHMHSSVSYDGEHSPKELINQCREAGLQTVAIADHNNAAGVGEAVMWGQEYGVEVIPAIELDCIFQEHHLHLLGYFIRYDNPIFQKIHEDVLVIERNAVEDRILKIESLGFYVNRKKLMELSQDGTINNPMILKAMLFEPENQHNQALGPYHPNGARSDEPFYNFYRDLCAPGKPGHAQIPYMSMEEAVRVIKEQGGVPVLAHPGHNIKEDARVLEDIIRVGVLGVEAYSNYHTVEQVRFYEQEAKRLSIVPTCGSDYHGKIKPKIELGGCFCSNREQEILTQLKALAL